MRSWHPLLRVDRCDRAAFVSDACQGRRNLMVSACDACEQAVLESRKPAGRRLFSNNDAE